MNRRRFLRQSSLALPWLAFSSAWLEACKKNQLEDAFSFKGSVAVIGAGASGLYAAFLLKSYGINVTVFEATSQWGGRIRTETSWADHPLEMGAEFIYGDRSLWYQSLASSSAPVLLDGADYFVVDQLPMPESSLSGAADKATFDQLLQGINNYSGEENSLFLYGVLNGLSPRLRAAFQALVANHRGADADQLGILGLARSEQHWSAGDGRYRANGRALQEAMTTWVDALSNNIVLNTPIAEINYSGGPIRLTDSIGNVHETDRVLMTVPVSMLNSGNIAWTPALPLLHRQSISKIGMARVLKIQLRFSSAFWPANMQRLLGGSVVPEYWSPSSLSGSSVPVLTAMAAGASADALAALGTDMVPAILQELDTLFGNGSATGTFIDSIAVDWGDEVYIRGGMSFTKQNEGDARSLLKLPVANRIYFAGEATHDAGHHGTVHGALETGYRAAIEILKS